MNMFPKYFSGTLICCTNIYTTQDPRSTSKNPLDQLLPLKRRLTKPRSHLKFLHVLPVNITIVFFNNHTIYIYHYGKCK